MTAPGGTPDFPTSLGMSTTSTITLLGEDLAEDLMGQVGLTELVYRMVTLRVPTPGQVRMLDACLLALADHGFTPTAIAARLTFLSAPDSVQGALAAGLLGGGSRFLGVTEDCGQFLAAVIGDLEQVPTDEEGWDEVARRVVQEARAERRIIPGLGHPVHKELDPRTPALIRIAHETGSHGAHLSLFEAIGRVHHEVLGRRLVLNGAGVVGAGLADLGLPLPLLRGFALLARAAGLLGQLAEELRMPVGMDTYLTVEHHARFVDPADVLAAQEEGSPGGGR
ncbi:citryl-CoA lyase [Nocardioides bruguierae]|uniref:citryl-CoA lyase n=1 Tax=Nocardioides bruguierae TaxID=2945102 RepID=UPI00201FF400|nr:citryl-CoA lyase [Nocardioides bruguierae]MCL8024498.1 citryl-CoA lyase [Nocardioides bruguierae]